MNGYMAVSEYEKQRDRNMKANHAVLVQLGIEPMPRLLPNRKPKKKSIMEKTRRAPVKRARRSPDPMVGKRIFVPWNGNIPFFGTVAKVDWDKARPVFLVYDDGMEKWELKEDVHPMESYIEVGLDA